MQYYWPSLEDIWPGRPDSADKFASAMTGDSSDEPPERDPERPA